MRTRLLLAAVLLLSACGGGTELPRAAPPTSPVPSPSASASASPSPAASPDAQAVRLTGDGIETPQGVLTFGQDVEQVQPALVAALGEPTEDTGVGESFSEYGTCPGRKLRALEFGDGALYVLFGDVIGPGLTMYQWTLTVEGRPADVPRASALVGDTATFEFGVGDSIEEIRQGVGEGAELEVFPGDEVFNASFRLTDQSAGFFGFLDSKDVTGRARFVQGGEGCGE